MVEYSINMQRLRGEIGSKRFDIAAVSGGGRGSTKGRADYALASFDTDRKANKKTRGGPIPPGCYVITKPAQHKRLGLAAFLAQTPSSLLQFDPASPLGIRITERDGFFIHGRGPSGSDGCIVPLEQFKELMDAIATAAPVLLRVIDPGAPWHDSFERKPQTRSALA